MAPLLSTLEPMPAVEIVSSPSNLDDIKVAYSSQPKIIAHIFTICFVISFIFHFSFFCNVHDGYKLQNTEVFSSFSETEEQRTFKSQITE